ncbi:MAG: hypothetical protein LH606_02960, partial [Cytophagaceae bacterium]|nr:hypothetical protein [Cytophagaceae bacterium]
MKKTLYRLVAWVLLSGLATLGYSQVIENADSTLAQAVAPNADDTPLFLLIGVFVLLVYALVLSYLYFFDARPKLRKKAPTWPTEGVMDPISPPTNIAEKQHLSQQNKQLRRDVRELEELIEKREFEMETMRLELKKRPAAP